MKRVTWLAGFLVAAAGACAPTEQERVGHHTQDGIQMFVQGSFADARDCFGAALKLRPDDPDLFYNLGRCHDRMGQPDVAERHYKECLQRAPDHLEARHAWVVLMRGTGRKDEAEAMVRDWRSKRSHQAAPHVEEGWLLAQAGNLPAARACYQKALDRDPLHARALAELGAIYEKQGRPDRALVLYQRSLEAQPDQPAVSRLVSTLRARGVQPPHPD
jgi:tetratricopeptide (TPR) repeat protein